MAQSTRVRSLLDLPEELLLHVFRHLQLLRKTRFGRLKQLDLSENDTRLQSLLAICRTCRRLHRICTPLLYSSIILGPAGSPAPPSLPLLLHTIIQQPSLAEFIKYIEESVADGLIHCDWDCNRLPYSHSYEPHHQFAREFDMAAFQIWSAPRGMNWEVANYEDPKWADRFRHWPDEAELALLIALAPNLQHLSLLIVNSSTPNIFDLVNFQSRGSDCPIPEFWNLRTLYLDTAPGADNGKSHLWWSFFDGRFPHIDSLREVRMRLDGNIPGFFPPPDSLSIEVLDLIYVTIPYELLSFLVTACRKLKQFTCRYDHFSWRIPVCLSDLRIALLKHKDTLQVLSLDTADLWPGPDGQPIGSFDEFSALKDLAINDSCLFGEPPQEATEELNSEELHTYWNNHRLASRISTLLPKGLESFTLRCSEDVFQDDGSFMLYDLAEDCNIFPYLTEIKIRSTPWALHTLASYFADHGVALRTFVVLDLDET